MIKLPTLFKNNSSQNSRFLQKKELSSLELKQSVPVKEKELKFVENVPYEKHRRQKTYEKSLEKEVKPKKHKRKVTVKLESLKEIQKENMK